MGGKRISKVELKKQLAGLGIKVIGNHIKKKDVKKILVKVVKAAKAVKAAKVVKAAKSSKSNKNYKEAQESLVKQVIDHAEASAKSFSIAFERGGSLKITIKDGKLNYKLEYKGASFDV